MNGNPEMDAKAHWDSIYSRKRPDEVSWYQPHLARSLEFIQAARLAPDSAIIDVGGGESTLVDDLLALGQRNITVVDLSEAALARAQERLGGRASQVTWRVGDIREIALPEAAYDFWHDRAVFHFLTQTADRRRYVEQVERSLKVDGHVVVATFGPGGPERCSGLEVARYSADALHAEFGVRFRKVQDLSELHHTPWGTEQEFVYCYCRITR